MSSQVEEKRAADRRANAMKMNYTKVKPTVVKHVLPDEVMSIYDLKVSRFNEQIMKRWIMRQNNVNCLDPHETVLYADRWEYQRLFSPLAFSNQ